MIARNNLKCNTPACEMPGLEEAVRPHLEDLVSWCQAIQGYESAHDRPSGYVVLRLAAGQKKASARLVLAVEDFLRQAGPTILRVPDGRMG